MMKKETTSFSLHELASFLAEHDGAPSDDPCGEAIRLMRVQADKVRKAEARVKELEAEREAWLDRLTTIIDEEFGMQPPIADGEHLSILEKELGERRFRDLAELQAREAELAHLAALIDDGNPRMHLHHATEALVQRWAKRSQFTKLAEGVDAPEVSVLAGDMRKPSLRRPA